MFNLITTINAPVRIQKDALIIRQLVDKYNNKVAAAKAAIEKINNPALLDEVQAFALLHTAATQYAYSSPKPIYNIDESEYERLDDRKQELYFKELKAAFWRKLLDSFDYFNVLSQDQYDNLICQISEGNAPEFSIDNVTATLNQNKINLVQYYKDNVVSFYERLSCGHKTNKSGAAAGFNNRLIFGYRRLHDYSYFMWDLYKSVNLISGIHNHSINRDELHQLLSDKQGFYGKWFAIGDFIEVKQFSSTVHIRLDKTIVDSFNMILAERFPDRLAS
ncbi:MAG: DUF4942 domain-containing protein [Mesoflavibacter sp.]|nr:DUF4942 domain-containing protein [Mesoflavibacter sp.]